MTSTPHTPQEGTARPANASAGRPQRLRGVVVGAKKMTKTITVAVERLVWHPKLRKQYRQTKNFLVHDEKEEARVGDVVRIEQTRPLSRRKYFRLVERTKPAPIPEEVSLEEEEEGAAS